MLDPFPPHLLLSPPASFAALILRLVPVCGYGTDALLPADTMGQGDVFLAETCSDLVCGTLQTTAPQAGLCFGAVSDSLRLCLFHAPDTLRSCCQKMLISCL